MRSIINESNLKNKKILLRLDLNVPLENGKIIDTTRIDKIQKITEKVARGHMELRKKNGSCRKKTSQTIGDF